LYSTIRLPRGVATWKTATSPSSAGRPSWLGRVAAAIVLTSVGASIGRPVIVSPRADGERVPPYCVLGDKTLRAIAAMKPQNEDALAQVPGVGAKKLEKYGIEVLAVINK
jgi:hypothetical protein